MIYFIQSIVVFSLQLVHFGGIGVEIVDSVKVISDSVILVFFIVVVIVVLAVSIVAAFDVVIGAVDGGISYINVVLFVTIVVEIIGCIVVTVNDIVSDIFVVISLSVEDISGDGCAVLIMHFCVVDRGDRDVVGIAEEGIGGIVRGVVDFIVGTIVVLSIVVISGEVDSVDDASVVKFSNTVDDDVVPTVVLTDCE